MTKRQLPSACMQAVPYAVCVTPSMTISLVYSRQYACGSLDAGAGARWTGVVAAGGGE